MDIALTIILTFLTTGSVAIFLEDAVYLYKNTLCPIKKRTLIWSSSAPTVRMLEPGLERDWRGAGEGAGCLESSPKLICSRTELPARTM